MQITWYFDVISPFAWLQWPAIKQLCSERQVSLRPILLAGLLDRHGHKGPAEIPGKRLFTYRHAVWRAQQQGRTLRFPPSHPFNPIPALRLCIAAGSTVSAVDQVLSWIWDKGCAADSAEALQPLARSMGIHDAVVAIGQSQVKLDLKNNFERALAAGVFGVPTLEIGKELFWGEDATELALAYLAQPDLFQRSPFKELEAMPVGIQRSV
ncbi:2-hydroxychromene-2-carboxylate isomerase [Pseudomarimonas arenosa]|uniref:2-hydroxychromene-2-carboxylate isomerase n=1 Tax=Pseudomarimonas arenosa TaxID=2774145 RepID=A0AAW3ZGI5_9GAMM|nr:DsbA family protein [Pseudomarimonas arenosa]MBD8524262.1 DsbA family protein [Pseudomarimonas arenosa]